MKRTTGLWSDDPSETVLCWASLVPQDDYVQDVRSLVFYVREVWSVFSVVFESSPISDCRHAFPVSVTCS